MPTNVSFNSALANPAGTVLDNLQPNAPLRTQIADALNAALKTRLVDTANKAKLPVLVGLLNGMSAVDLIASQSLSLRAVVEQQVDPMVADDVAMKTEIDAEIAKLPGGPTVGAALGLALPVSSNPLLKTIVADAQLSTLLAASPVITPAMQARFVQLYDAKDSDMSDFWAQLSGDPVLGPVVPQLQLTLQLSVLTDNNPDMVAKLLAAFQPRSTRDLTKIDASQLAQLMTSENIQVPSSVAPATTPDTIAAYADSVIGTLKEAFPTDYIAKSFAASIDATNRQVASFLTKFSDFDLSTTNIDSYLENHEDAFAGIAEDEVTAITSRLKAAQRVARVTPDGDAIQTMLSLALDSSYKIATTPSGAFLDQYADKLGGEDQARQIYANATTVFNVTTLIIRQAQENNAIGTPRIIQSGSGQAQSVLNHFIPNWQTLFGSTSTCQCKECRAADGPAAYFVSLLQWLNGIDSGKPLKVLLARRPDLANLKLNCANADTALPYVDIVNEILESYVANGKLAASTAHDTPTDATTAALDANPEYVRTPDAINAYAALSSPSVVYPFSLPYDRYLTAQRNYLNFMGLGRYQLLQAFGLSIGSGTPSPQQTQIFSEYLSISEPEHILIAGADFEGFISLPFSTLAPYFNGNESISSVSQLLRVTGLSFSNLLALLETQYLNPNHLNPPAAISISLTGANGDPCDISQMTINNSEALLRPLSSFIRLWKKLGWKITEMDYALRAFGDTAGAVEADFPYPVPMTFIPIATQIQQLMTTLNLSVSQTVSLWQDIDADGRTSPYMTLFQNKAVVNPPDADLELEYQVPLSAIPSPLPNKWSDGTDQKVASFHAGNLNFAGSMTDRQRDDLLNWAGSNDACILAIQLLYDQRWFAGIDVAKLIADEPPFPHPPIPNPLYVADVIGNHINPIIAALRISASDLLTIATDAGLYEPESNNWARLSLANLSTLYRYALLAQALGYSVTNLITLKNLSGIQPFTLYKGADRPATDPMVQFVTLAQQVSASQFSVAQLAYLYGSAPNPASDLNPLQAVQDGVISTILAGLQNIAAANAFTSDPAGASLQKKLSVLLPSALQLRPTMALISGSALYTTQLDALPAGLTLPSGQISFVSTITVGVEIGFAITTGDTLTLSVTGTGLAPTLETYVVLQGDTLNSIALGLGAAINHDPTLAAAGIVATVTGAVISIAAPVNVSGSPIWTPGASPGTATETLTVSSALLCQSPLSKTTAAALVALAGADTDFTNAIWDLFNQAQDVLSENLRFLTAPGPYSAQVDALPVLPPGGTLPSQISIGTDATIDGTATAGDVLSVSVSSASLANPATVNYTVQPGDTIQTIALGIGALINRSPQFINAGITAESAGAVIGLSAPPGAAGFPVWTESAHPAAATETVTFGSALICQGAMLNSTRIALLALAPDGNFADAVNGLYDQAWSATPVSQSVEANLIPAALGSPVAPRYDYVLQGLLSYLTNTQSRNLVKQSLAQAIGLDPGIVDLLLEGSAALSVANGLIPSNFDPTQSAMSDFLGGLAATYTVASSPNPEPRIDPGVALDGTEAAFTSVVWTGKLVAPTSGGYAFAVPIGSPTGPGSPTILLTVNGQSVTPATGPGASGATTSINLSAGQVYDIALEIQNAPPSAAIQLEWCIVPLGLFAPIPALAMMPCDTTGAYPTLALLYRAAVLISGFSMSAADIAYLSTHPLDFAGTDPVTKGSVPFSLSGLPAAASQDAPALLNQWQGLNALYGLKASLPTSNVTLFDVFAMAASLPEAGAMGVILSQEIVAATGWNATDLQTLVGSTGFNFVNANFRNQICLVQIASCLGLCATIGASAETLFQWANPSGLSDHYGIAHDLQNTIKAKYDEATWLQVVKPLSDSLRESSKEALIAYILAMPSMADYPNRNALYEYFLIDVEMCACMQTSRLVQATAAVQLFVQQCLLNLEAQVKPSAFHSEDVQEWTQWRKNYRVWQAAVEVFLYPENWIVPELRTNQTPFFQDLATALLQSDVTADNVESAYLAYLESVQQVARLEIVGVYADNDQEARTQITHIIGRTVTTPHIYFYRTLNNNTYVWSPWEQISADISGDTLIPVIWNRRLFLFWPLYSETADPSKAGAGPTSIQSSNGTTTMPQSQPPNKTLQIQLAWSEYKSGNWTAKQTTSVALIPSSFKAYAQALDVSQFVYTASVSETQDQLVVTGYQYFYRDDAEVRKTKLGTSYYRLNAVGSFRFDGSQSFVTTDAPTHIGDPLQSEYQNVSEYYARLADPSDPFSSSTSQYVFQNICLSHSPFGVAFSENNGAKLGVFELLAGPSGGIPSFSLSLPQKYLPAYAIDVPDKAFEKIAFYADSRRSYFLTSGLTSFKSTVVRRATNATLPNYAWTGIGVYFYNHYHPWVGEFIKRLNWKGIPSLLDPSTQALDSANPSSGVQKFQFKPDYAPTPYVATPYPKEIVDFKQTFIDPTSTVNPATPPGDFAYSLYNWEIFFYAPLLIATQLSQNQQFKDAQTWFHYIFNPTQDPGANVSGYWNFQPLNQMPPDKGLAQLLATLGTPNGAANAQWNEWVLTPFDPDVIARLRLVAYQKTVLMKYLDNLIAWGDYLFSQNTRESINESIQIYVLADQILGPAPVTIAQIGTVVDLTYSQLVSTAASFGENVNQLGNANVQLENAFPLIASGLASGSNGSTVKPPMTSYFCTPPNGTLQGYYDTIADRLYKIRHCMNIQGQVEQLPLFSPPINPALLVAAEAAGVDLSSVLNDINAAVPFYRFTSTFAKALELCSEVRSLGSALLAALEKYDSEGLTLLRAGQEVSVLQAVLQIKQLQIQEAADNYAGLLATQQIVTARQSYYNALLQGGLSGYENAQVAAMALATEFKIIGQVGDTTAAGLAMIPQVIVGVNGFGGSPSAIVSFGGEQTSGAASAMGRALGALGEISSFVAAMAALMGGWDRRATEWTFQYQTATLELAQIQQQIAAAGIRSQIASDDFNNQNLQISNASAVQDVLKSKFTNQQLYSWMKDQVSAIFFQCYQMAYDLAKRSEVCYRFELGVPQSNYIRFGYWDSLKQGLLAGEKLFQDLKRLEGAYMDQNRREYEISRNISILLLDPAALIWLKQTGQCVITLPEAYFDMDYPGHYMRRIKSVSLTIPCVTGPYTSVNCTLKLLQSRIRLNNNGATVHAYPEQPFASDARFSYDFSSTESIATSTAQNDSGLFEVSFRDERYLPFEGSGAICQLQLSMPPDCNAFDFETITDVILNLRYTSRDGGAALFAAAKAAAILPPRLAQTSSYPPAAKFPKQTNLLRSFSLRHEYPTEWYKFLNPPAVSGGSAPAATLQIALNGERFQFQFRNLPITITKADFYVIVDPSSQSLPASLDFQLYPPANPPASGAPPLIANAGASLPTTLTLNILNPPPPGPIPGGPPKSWVLGCVSDLSQVKLIDIVLICEFSASIA